MKVSPPPAEPVIAVRPEMVSVSAVEQGVEVTGQAGESIQGIIREADVMGRLVAQIAGSATQQAAATEEVTASMRKIYDFAASSASGAHLSARACEQLFNLALGLEKLVDRFDVGQKEKVAEPHRRLAVRVPAGLEPLKSVR